MPLREVSGPTRQLAENLYSIGPELYVFVHEMNSRFEHDPVGGPFVTLAIWAPSDGAARRAALDDLQADDGAEAPVPESVSFGWGETRDDESPYAAVMRLGQ